MSVGQRDARLGILFLTVLILATSCDQATNAAKAIGALAKITRAISAIPAGSEMLPASLRDVTSAAKAARAIGDVTTLDPTTAAGVRSEGYVRMQKEIGESVLSNIMAVFQSGLSALSEVAYGTEFSLGDVNLTKAQAAVLGVAQKIDAGKAVATENSDRSVDVKWHLGGSGHFRLPNSTAPGP
jgi:hypothetical protein